MAGGVFARGPDRRFHRANFFRRADEASGLVLALFGTVDRFVCAALTPPCGPPPSARAGGVGVTSLSKDAVLILTLIKRPDSVEEARGI